MARILTDGPSALCDTELVSLLLGVRDDLLAARLLTRGLAALSRATPGQLLFTPGMNRQHVERVLAAVELGRRVVFAPAIDRPRLTSAQDLATVVWGKLAQLPHEEFWVILLNARL